MKFGSTSFVLGICCANMVLSGCVVFWIIRWKANRSRSRPPLPFKLLRAPGESLRRRIERTEEKAVLVILACGLAPIVLMLCALHLVVRVAPQMPAIAGWATIGTAGLLGSGGGIFWLYRLTIRLRNDFLGYLGERAVGEYLYNLRGGYHVFNDVPARGEKKPFNLDHVVVSSRGISLIETKTRRKRRSRSGRDQTSVTYDGEHLRWPWGIDDDGITQAAGEAVWLQKWIFQKTGISTPVRPILAIPGWYTHGEGEHPIKVVNEQRIWVYVDHGKEMLEPNQVIRIAAELEKVCRDVVD
jgi:hypothetical protein